MAVLHKFRSAIGGFHRRDVMNYIEAADRASREQIARLEGQLKAEADARAALEEELEASRSWQGAAAAEEAKVRACLEESTHTLGLVRGELTQAESQLAVAKGELERLRAQVAQMEPMARNYEELKERVALVELDAHRKAQATMEEAQAQAEAIRRETKDWLRGVVAEYDRLRTAVDGQVEAIGRLAECVRASGEAAEQLRGWSEEA